ncbi:NEL-type E3 ubiquitin ligase domain-containing protein [Pseudomonas putida]|uniref:NEL-type E3 ubiquitin ligase domain-containing protein n=1 Tax=Pseudomonas putida TaxID=303 RepID=UPI003D01FA39
MTPPLHHAQIVRTLPAWSKTLHPDHVQPILSRLRKEYLDKQGQPYAWFSQASPVAQQAIRDAITLRDQRRQALHAALAPLKGIVEFCEPLLSAGLGDEVSVTEACFVHQSFELKKPTTGPSPLGQTPPRERSPVIPKGAAQTRTLLEAALHNFTADTEVQPLDRLQRSAMDIQPIPGLTLASFIRHCRQLDLGQSYQRHLATVLDHAKDSLPTLWRQANQAELRVQARIAHVRGRLSDAGLTAIEQLCAGVRTPRYGTRAVRCWRMILETVDLHELLLIGPDAGSGSSPIIVYLPSEAGGSVHEYASRAHATRVLRQALADSAWRRRLITLAPLTLQPVLERALRKKLFAKPDEAKNPRPKVHLTIDISQLPEQPWSQLYTLHVLRLKGDARAIAVPTADVDAKQRLASLTHWLEAGLTVLNVAAMFVPALNPLMMALGAAQIMGSVFHGIEAWEEGDNAQALAQVESILLNVVSVAAVAGAGVTLQRAGFVDALRSVVDEGRERLWSASLEGYRSDTPLAEHAVPDSRGVYLQDERRFIRIEGEVFEALQGANGQLRVRHPRGGYAPRLCSNGHGAWRLTAQSPLDWSDGQLLRRFGPVADGLDDDALSFAMHSTETTADSLRYTHIDQQPPPARLADSLTRLDCDGETDALIEAVRHGRPLAAYKHYAVAELPHLPGWPQDHGLKVFAGPEPWGLANHYSPPGPRPRVEIVLTQGDLESGQLSATVLAQLDESARASLRGNAATLAASDLDERLALRLQNRRHSLFTSLYQQRQPQLDDTHVPIARQFPSLPGPAVLELEAHATVAERSRLAAGRVPLRLAEEARLLQRQVRLDRALAGLFRPGLANADSRMLNQSLLAEHPGATPERILQLALADREHCAALLGQRVPRPEFRSPMRLSDGRIGYPLSGRPRLFERLRNLTRNIPDERLQELFPGLTAGERRELLQRLRERGDVGQQITALQREQEALDATLQAWENAAEAPYRRAHARVRQQLNRAWRADPPAISRQHRAAGGTALELSLEGVQSLPPLLPARFDHVASLSLYGPMQHLPAGILQSFPYLQTLRIAFAGPGLDSASVFQALRNTPRLRALALPSNGLTMLTDEARRALQQLTELRQLDLSSNALNLATEDIDLLNRLPLEHLRLRHNQISLDAAQAERFGQMTRLQTLDLSANPQIGEVPNLARLLRLRSLNMSQCGLTSWPASLMELMANPNSQLRSVILGDNRITDIPNLDHLLDTPYFRTLGPGQRALLWRLDLSFNGLRPRAAQRLRAAGARIDEVDGFLPADQAVNWLDHADTAQQRTWRDLFDNGENASLREVIERLGRSAQARGNPETLSDQVWRMLTRASENTQLRNRLEEVAAQFPATCGDAGADGFSTLEVELLAFDESADGEIRGPHLFNFYRRLFRREQVNVLASRIYTARAARQAAHRAWLEMQTDRQPNMPDLPPLDDLDDLSLEQLEQSMVDEIEIRLALRQALAQELEFPEPSQDMLYRQTAQISAQVEDNVGEAVRLIDEGARARRRWIARQPSWMRFLEQRFADSFETVKGEWSDAQEYLDHCADPSSEPPAGLAPAVVGELTTALSASPLDDQGRLRRIALNSERYDQASRAVAGAREAALDALYLRLTAEQDPNG